MHVQVIQYEYAGDVDAFKRMAESHAPTVAANDGFVAKLWLNGEGRRFGGVYVWRDRQAADAYEHSELFTTAISGSPEVRDLTIDHYELWSAPTAVTNGGLPFASGVER